MLYLTGIHHPDQISSFDPASWSGQRRRIAIDLIDDIDKLGNPAAREALFERIVDARGAFKRTYRDRFAAFDARLIEIWKQHPPAARAVRVLDTAVSDGSTTLPLIAAFQLLTAGDFQYTATDLDGRYIRLYRATAPDQRIILSEAGAVVQIIRPPFLFTHRESRHLFPLNRILRPAAERFAATLVADWRRGAPEVRENEIYLFNPDFRRVLECNERVAFRAWDILQPWTGELAHCVRAMNVLNPGYFDATQLRLAARHLFDALAEGGLLALGSNENAGTEVDGIIARRTGKHLEVITQVGAGFRAPDAIAPLLQGTPTS